MKRRAPHVVVCAALALSVLATLSGAGAAAPARPAPAKSPPKTFSMSGDVTGLYPGSTTALAVRVDNPQNFAIVVGTLDVTASDAATGCLAANLSVGPAPLPLVVPSNGTAYATVPIGLIADAADACQGATFPLTFRGTATKR